MASHLKRKADSLDGAVNGTETKRARTGTPPKVNGDLNESPSSPALADGKAPEVSPKSSSKKLRKAAKRAGKTKRKHEAPRQEKENGEEPLVNGHSDGAGSAEGAATTRKKKNHRRQKTDHHRWVGNRQSDLWDITDPTGGALLDLDPIFSQDEKHFLLAYDHSIRVYAISTKLLVRTLYTRKGGYITGFSIVPEKQSQLFVSLISGFIEKWDWQDGERLSRFNADCITTNLALSTGRSHDLVYAIEKHKKRWHIVAHRLRKGEDAELHKLYSTQEPISHFQVWDQGRFIIASAGKRVILGSLDEPSTPTSTDILYTWRELECNEWITCLDVRMSESEALGEKRLRKKGQSTSGNPPAIDIVVGGLQGSLWVYRDLLGRLVRNEQGKGDGAVIPQRLHWHRNGVGAVRWALEGNYLISGGNETVIIRWQLDTNRQTKLPHLSAPIESIVVSPSGSLYCIRFANNTAMVLSSAEMEPIVQVPGPRILIRRPGIIDPPDYTHMSTQFKNGHLMQSNSRAAAAIRSSPSGLLIAVPGASPSRTGLPVSTSAPFLQTLDARDGSHLSLQALTRTNTTIKNIGPETNLIVEPNVVLTQLSHDGQWLATVDEWIPPSLDFERLSIDESDLARQQILHMEVYLKIWSWAAKSSTWELVMRIDNPHMRNDGQSTTPQKVLDLIPDSSHLGFVTIGTDAQVKVWRSRHRFRDGQQVRAQDGTPLTSWFCESSLSLPIAITSDFGNMSTIVGRLACSSDSSVFAAAFQADPVSEPSLHLVSASPLEINSSLPGLFPSNLKAIAFLSQYLILLSDHLHVYDIVNNCTIFETSVEPASGMSPSSALSLTHLAVDYKTNTFAMIVPEWKSRSAEIFSQVAVFDPTQGEPLFKTNFKHGTVALLPLSGMEEDGKGGYVILDCAACVRHLRPKTMEIMRTGVETQTLERKTFAGLETLFGANEHGSKALVVANGVHNGSNETAVEGMELDDDDETPFVRAHQLKDALDVGSLYNLPKVESLFEKVAGLYISRPTD